jgi:hypothetical protein
MNAAVISRQATERDLQAMLDTLVPTFADDPVWVVGRFAGGLA